MIHLRTIISNRTKKIHFALNHERASIARKAAMDIINNQGMEVSIGGSNNQCIILSKFHLINISRASLMSLDERVTMTCGDIRQDLIPSDRTRIIVLYVRRGRGLTFGSA